MTAPARAYDSEPDAALGGRPPAAHHGGPVYRRLVALETEGRAQKGQRWLFHDGRVPMVIRVRDVAPDEQPVLGRWDSGAREDFGPWLCNVAELLPEEQPRSRHHEEAHAHAEGPRRSEGRRNRREPCEEPAGAEVAAGPTTSACRAGAGVGRGGRA